MLASSPGIGVCRKGIKLTGKDLGLEAELADLLTVLARLGTTQLLAMNVSGEQETDEAKGEVNSMYSTPKSERAVAL